MILDIKEVMDYCSCPMYYKLKYMNKSLKSNDVDILEKYNNDIHKTIYSFFANLQNFDQISISAMKRTFGMLWIGKKDVPNILIQSSSWRDTRNRKRKSGINTIVNIFDTFKDNPGFPLIINKKYSVKINENITLTGTWEIIREVDHKIQLIDFKIGDKFRNRFIADTDLEITAGAYAFNKSFGTTLDNIMYYGLDKNKIHYTNRDKAKYDILLNTINCVAKSIYNKLFYVYPSDKCQQCIYNSICN